MKKDYFFLAVGNLKHRGLRSWLTILGVFIGIAAVVGLIMMGEGLRTAITAQFSSLSTDKLVIQNVGTGMGPPGSTAVKKITQHDAEVINKVAGVEKTIPRLIRIAKTEFNKNANFNYIASIPNEAESEKIIYDSMNVKLKEGRLLKSGDSGKIVIGSDIAKENLFGKEIAEGNKIIIQ